MHFDSAPVSNFDLMAELDKENFCVFCRKARISDDVEPLQVLRNLNVFDTRSGCPKAGAVMFLQSILNTVSRSRGCIVCVSRARKM